MTTRPTIPTPLIRAAVAGDGQALERLVEASIPLVLAWCYRLAAPGVDPEDAAQQILLVLFDRVHGLRDTRHFGGWLFGVTRRVLARQREKALAGTSGEQGLQLAPPPDQAIVEGRFNAQVRAVLARLPEDQREVLVLYDGLEHTAAEAAVLLGVPEGTVRSRVRLGRARFRKLVAEDPRLCASLDLPVEKAQ